MNGVTQSAKGTELCVSPSSERFEVRRLAVAFLFIGLTSAIQSEFFGFGAGRVRGEADVGRVIPSSELFGGSGLFQPVDSDGTNAAHGFA